MLTIKEIKLLGILKKLTPDGLRQIKGAPTNYAVANTDDKNVIIDELDAAYPIVNLLTKEFGDGWPELAVTVLRLNHSIMIKPAVRAWLALQLAEYRRECAAAVAEAKAAYADTNPVTAAAEAANTTDTNPVTAADSNGKRKK